MKRIFAAAILLLSIPVFAQKAAPELPKKPTELQQLKIDNAIKDFQIAQFQAQQSAENAQQSRDKAVAQIAAVKAELKLDETWTYDEQQKAFVKVPVPAKVAEPAKPESPAKK